MIACDLGLFSFVFPHGKGDAHFLDVYADNGYVNHVAYADDFAGMLDEAVGDLGNVNQAVLMNADIDKRAEIGDVANRSANGHAVL